MATVNPSLDNTLDDPSQRSPLVLGDLDYGGVTDTVCKIWEAEKQPKIWYIVLGLALSLLLILGGCLNHLIMKGTGVWGCLLYTSPSPRDRTRSRMPSSA